MRLVHRNRRKLKNRHGCCPQSCRCQLRRDPQHTPVRPLIQSFSIIWTHFRLLFLVHKYLDLYVLGMLTEQRTSNAMLLLTRIPTTSWSGTWRTRCLGWRSCSVPRALETFWTVSLLLTQRVVFCCRTAATVSLDGTQKLCFSSVCTVYTSKMLFNEFSIIGPNSKRLHLQVKKWWFETTFLHWTSILAHKLDRYRRN